MAAMAAGASAPTDLLAANQRPWMDVAFQVAASGACLYLDDGAAEALRWAGGLRFALGELGAHGVFAMPATSAPRSSSSSPPSFHGTSTTKRSVVVVTRPLWECEAGILNALLLSEAREALVCCSVTPEAHSCYEQAAMLYGEEATPNFADVGSQFQETLGNLRRRDARNSGGGEEEGGAPCTIHVVHFPLHAVAPLQPAALPCRAAGASDAASAFASTEGVGWFTLAGAAAANAFPLQRHQLRADLRESVAPDLHDVSGADIPQACRRSVPPRAHAFRSPFTS